MDESTKAFLEDVYLQRRKQGRSQAWLSIRCGVSRAVIYGVENRLREPKLSLAIKLANTLGLTISDY